MMRLYPQMMLSVAVAPVVIGKVAYLYVLAKHVAQHSADIAMQPIAHHIESVGVLHR